jgi:hypothetical protein
MTAPFINDQGELVLTLPIPAKEISPNASRGQSRWAAVKKSKIVKQHRENAFIQMSLAYKLFDHRPPKVAGYNLAHYFKTAAYRDDDNADGACKAYRDGIAQALGIDDRNFKKNALSTIGKDAANPRVEIKIKLA